MQLKGSLFHPVPSQLLAWPADVPEAVTVVTIAPDFHGVHHGYITNLKKFTAYFTSVLCFTTPGDGPPSTPQLIRTHEDSEYSFPSVLSIAFSQLSKRFGPLSYPAQGKSKGGSLANSMFSVCSQSARPGEISH